MGRVRNAIMAAAENHIGQVSIELNVIDVTLVADTAIYANGDVLAVPQVVSNAARVPGGGMILDSVAVLDEDLQSVAIDLIFFDVTTTLGTINAAVSITDANARKIIGQVSIAAADFKSLIGSSFAHLKTQGVIMKAAAGTRDIYVAAVVRSGTPTYTASGLKLKLGFRY